MTLDMNDLDGYAHALIGTAHARDGAACCLRLGGRLRGQTYSGSSRLVPSCDGFASGGWARLAVRVHERSVVSNDVSGGRLGSLENVAKWEYEKRAIEGLRERESKVARALDRAQLYADEYPSGALVCAFCTHAF